MDKLAAMRALGDAGVPGGALRSTTEVYEDTDLRERGIFVMVDDPGKGGAVTIPAYPVRLSRSPARVAAPPQPGQHTAEVLRDWLGEGAELTVPGGAADEDKERRRATPGGRHQTPFNPA